MKFLQKLFSIKNDGNYKVIRFFGIKKRKFNLKKELKPILKYIKYAKYQINKDMIDVQIAKFHRRQIVGINQTEERNPKIIVSLTTFPERIGDVHYAIYSLLNQTVKPDKVILWLAEEQFPDREDDISQAVLDLKSHGLTIKYTKDIKSYKKLIPALKEYPEDIIVTADDDIYYPENWLEKLYSEYLQNPNQIYAHRVHKAKLKTKNILNPYKKWTYLIDDESVSFLNYPTTGGGVLYPPKSLYKDVCDEELFMKLSPTSDDAWFWIMAVLNHKKIKVVKGPINNIALINALNQAFGNALALYNMGVDNKQDEQLKNILNYYPEITDILKSNNTQN